MTLPKIQLQRKNIRAFTLLEVLTSLSIVTLVIMGPLISTVSSSSYAGQSKDVMVATYLAEEALELLHYQRDSLYIQCLKKKGACVDDPIPRIFNGSPGEDETIGEQAWRIFKIRLNNGSSIVGGISPVSCFSGCAYDFFDMSDATTTVPQLYLPTSDECRYLALVSVAVEEAVPIIRHYYACSGVPSHTSEGYSVKKTSYSREIIVESKDTFEETLPPEEERYNDDLLITANVSFRRTNGTVRTITVTDFLRARS